MQSIERQSTVVNRDPIQRPRRELRALDYFRVASALDGTAPDRRCAEAIALIEAKQDAAVRWQHENTHEGARLLSIEGSEGELSRWSTLRAMRVLKWWAG